MTLPFFGRAAGRPLARSGVVAVVNPAPTDIILSGDTIAYDAASGTVVGVLSVTDPGESSWTFAITGGAGASKFALSTSTGSTVQLLRGLSGTLTGGVSESVQITVTDGAGGQRAVTFSIGVVGAIVDGTLLYSRTMIGTGAAAGTVYTFAEEFEQGTVDGTGRVFCKRGSNSAEVITQVNPLTTWPDGSLKMALMAIELWSLANGATESLDFYTGVNASPGPNLSMATQLTGRTATVEITPSGGSTFTFDAAGNIGAYRFRSGPLAVEARAEVAIPSANFSGSTGGRLTVDLLCLKDGSLFIDPRVGNDNVAWPEDTVTTANVAMVAKLDGVTMISVSGLIPAGSAGSLRIAGRKTSGTVTYDPCFLRPNPTQMNKAMLAAKYNTTRGVSSSWLSTVQAARAGGSWNNWTSGGSTTPIRNLIHNNPTGNNENLYGIPFGNAGAAWIVGGDKDFYLYACEQAEAWHCSAYFYFDKTNNRWLNGSDRAGFRAHTSNGSFRPAVSTDPTQTFRDDGAHHPMVLALPWLLRGRRMFLDGLIGFSTARAMNAYNSDGQGGFIWAETSEQQVRTAAYLMAEMALCYYGLPATYPQTNVAWLKANLEANLQWQLDQRAFYESRYGEMYGAWDQYGRGVTWAIWQDNLVLSALCLLAKQGYTKAATLADWKANFLVTGWTRTDTNMPTRMTNYNFWNQPNAGGTPFTTWAAAIAETNLRSDANGENTGLPWSRTNPDSQVYVTYAQMMLAYYAWLRPSSSVAQNGCIGYDAEITAGLVGASTAQLQAAPKNNFDRPSGFSPAGGP